MAFGRLASPAPARETPPSKVSLINVNDALYGATTGGRTYGYGTVFAFKH
jgi:hypothetical protein